MMRSSWIEQGFSLRRADAASDEAGTAWDTGIILRRRKRDASQPAPTGAAEARLRFERQSPPQWNVEMRPVVACKPIAGEWRALMSRAIEKNVFAGPEAMIAAAQHLPASQPPMALVIRSSRKLIAIIPLASGRSPTLPGAVQGYMTPFQPTGVPLVDAQHFDAAMRALTGWLSSQNGARQAGSRHFLGPAGIMWKKLPLHGAFSDAVKRFAAREGLSTYVLESYSRPVLANGSLKNDPASARHRQNLRRLARRLEDLGPVSITEASRGEALNQALETLLALEAAGWKGEAGTAMAQDARTSCFIRSLVRQLGRTSEATIFTLASNEKPIACALAFGFAGSYFCFKIAHCPEHARYSPGLMLAQSVGERLAARADFRQADSCADDESSFMRRLWKDEIIIGDIVLELPCTSQKAVAAMLWRERMARRIRLHAKAAYHNLIMR